MDDIVALSNLIQSSPAVGDEFHPRYRIQRDILTPATFGQFKNETLSHRKDDDTKRGKSYTHLSDNDIWPDDNLQENFSSDTKNEPMYEIYFKQIIGTEDVFFGTDRTPLTSDCTHIVVKVHFPGSTLNQLELDVYSTRLLVESSKE